MRTYTFAILKNYPTERQFVVIRQPKKGILHSITKALKGR